MNSCQGACVQTSEQPTRSLKIKKVLGLLLKNPEILSFLYTIDFHDNVPLWKAMFDAAEEIVEILKEFDADVNEWLKLIWEKIYCQNTSLNISDRSFEPQKMEKVLGLLFQTPEIPSILLSSDSPDSSILEAMIDGSEELSEFLDDFDIDVDTWYVLDENTRKKTTFIHWFASSDDWEKKIKVLEVLIKIGADINAKNKDNITPLEIAVNKGNLDCVEFLLHNEATLNSKSIIDLLLKKLKMQDRKEMLKLLIKYDVNLLDDFWTSEGENLLHFVSKLENNYKDVIEIAKIIIDAAVPLEDSYEDFTYMPTLIYY